MDALISLTNVEKVYGTALKTQALKPVNLEIGYGELVVILGPSGSGKTTLLNLLGGLDAATRGEVRVDGVALSSLKPNQLADFRREKVGFIFQLFNLIPSLTVRENVQLAADLLNREEYVDEMLAAVDLTGRADHFPSQLSGGQQQRVAIARALVKNPPLLLCDEPIGALDYETGKQILTLLETMVYEHGKTVIIVTHNNALAAIATRLIRIKDGQVTDEVCATPVPAAQLTW